MRDSKKADWSGESSAAETRAGSAARKRAGRNMRKEVTGNQLVGRQYVTRVFFLSGEDSGCGH